MNKRQYKKFVRKYHKKSYYEVRWKEIHKNILDKYGPDYNVICITDSHRMDLKHPIKITVYKNAYPKSVTFEPTDNDCNGAPELCEANAILHMLNEWKKGVLNESQMESL